LRRRNRQNLEDLFLAQMDFARERVDPESPAWATERWNRVCAELNCRDGIQQEAAS
jgi:hypothetical protein